MKKYLSLLAAAALILTAAGCGNSTEAETTTAAETTTTAAEAETEETTTAAEAETEETTLAEAEDEAIDEDDSTEEVEGTLILEESYLSALAEKAPLYAEYARVSGTVPYTADLTVLDAEGNETMETLTSMASLNELAMVMTVSGASTRIVMADYTYYMISDETKEGIVQTLDEETWNQTISSALSNQNLLNIDALEVTTGEEELFGATYTVEELNDGTMDVKCYFNTESNKAEYIATSAGEGESAVTAIVKVGEYYNGVDESIFDIPEDYSYTDMSAAQD